MLIKKWIVSLGIVIICIAWMGCQSATDVSSLWNQQLGGTAIDIHSNTGYAEYEKEDYFGDLSGRGVDQIHLKTDRIQYNGRKADVVDNEIVIEETGIFRVSGWLENGVIRVDAGDTGIVHLILDTVEIRNESTSPIQVDSAQKVIITLVEGTENRLYVQSADHDRIDGVIHAQSDLTINGGGQLTIDAPEYNGIEGNDEIKLMDGILRITACKTGVVANQGIIIKDGRYDIKASDKGLSSTKDRSMIIIEGGDIQILCEDEGIKTSGALAIGAGVIAIDNHLTEKKNAVGMYGGERIEIFDGELRIRAHDDALRSDHHIVMWKGKLYIESGNDGISATESFVIHDGHIEIAQSYEGIESANVTVHGGIVEIQSADDGINVSVEDDNDRGNVNGLPRLLTINGGVVYVRSNADGLDANGSIHINDGWVIVHSSERDKYYAIDYDHNFTINGGTVIAVGNYDHQNLPSTMSRQNMLIWEGTQAAPAGSTVQLTGSEQYQLTFQTMHAFQALMISTPALTEGSRYALNIGGQAEGVVEYGVYSDAQYHGGQLQGEAVLQQRITVIRPER